MVDIYDPYSSVGLLSEEDRARASKLGWLNAAANLFDASAPQVGGQQKTPFQLLGTGLRGYAQGTQESTDRIAQERAYQRKLEDEQKRKDWAANISGKLDQYGISQDVATGMSPESIAKMIVDAEDDKRKYAQQSKLEEMKAQRQLAVQQEMLNRQNASGALDPASVREWKAFSSMPPDQQARYLQMKRADQIMNLGGTMAVRSPTGGVAESYQVTPKPEQMPEFKGAQKSAEVGAEMQAKAAGDLGGAEATAQQMLGLIDQVKNHEGLSAAVGAPNPLKGNLVVAKIPGSAAADFQAKLDQLGGQNFLQAFQSLKGGGQITEVEGKKATDAIASMQTSQSEKQFKASLDELRRVVESGLARARAKAAGKVMPGMQSQTSDGGIKFMGFE